MQKKIWSKMSTQFHPNVIHKKYHTNIYWSQLNMYKEESNKENKIKHTCKIGFSKWIDSSKIVAS